MVEKLVCYPNLTIFQILFDIYAQLVKRMVRIARELGRKPTNVDEAKELLGLK
ncbi:MAG: 3-keto-5-aminohexanoate cleavage protein [Candidatus Hermodarchaeota archaeon]